MLKIDMYYIKRLRMSGRGSEANKLLEEFYEEKRQEKNKIMKKFHAEDSREWYHKNKKRGKK